MGDKSNLSKVKRVIICGGRDFNDYDLLAEKCDEILGSDFSNIEIVSGRARGADQLGERYGINRGISVKFMPANWDKFGKSAGYIRNSEMREYAKGGEPLVIAFWDGKSRGTQHMITTARQSGIPVQVIKY